MNFLSKGEGEIISDECKVANELSNFFENTIHSLAICIKTNKYSNENYSLKNLVEIAIKKYEQHLNINLINENIKNESLNFLPTEQESIF